VTERRFFVEPQGSTLALGEDESHHARRVLRLEPGAHIICFDGRGASWRARIARYEQRLAVLEIVETLPIEPAPLPRVCLAVGLLKGEKMDLVVQKATELGVASVLPLSTDFSEARSDVSKRVARWRRIALEAAKQCERNHVPEIATPVVLGSALRELTGIAVAFVERDGGSLREFVAKHAAGHAGALTVFIGPEGGWSGSERAAFRAAEVASVSLGLRILRAETAAIASLAILAFAFEKRSTEPVSSPSHETRG
jgi:16S rRNA (uracil1498-N3)-methyltransferase